jgi:hypothetical protein
MRYLSITILIFFTISCSAGAFKQLNVESHILFKEVDNLSKGNIGFLTTTVGTGEEKYRRVVMNILAEVIKNNRKDLKIVPPSLGFSLINSKELADEYAKGKKDYEITGIWNKEVLRKIGKAMGVRYLIQPELIKFETWTNTRVNLVGIRLMETRESTIRVFMQIWDTETGAIVWEGAGEATFAKDSLKSRPVRFEDIMRIAWKDLIKKLPGKEIKKGEIN